MQVTGKIDDLMENNDWALIFDGNGRIKGIFIPDGSEESDAPPSMLAMLQAVGIDMFTDGASLH
tara:strand:+ start:1062 stop:1253 length:192 start_codon:yes stop_codon:yes gene_type:complete